MPGLVAARALARYGFFDRTVDVVFVLFRPGAVELRPCDTVEDGVVFVRPGALVLRPRDTPA